jgi:hypothetical protein
MKRLLPTLLLLPALAVAGIASAQQLRSGPNEPAVGAQIPPTSLPNEAGDRSGAEPERPRDDPPRTAPPADHRVLGAPPVPGATQPEASEGFTTNRDRIPARPADRPDASTTGR